MKAIVYGWEIVAPFSNGRAISSYAKGFRFSGRKFSRGTFTNAQTILSGNFSDFKEEMSWDLSIGLLRFRL